MGQIGAITPPTRVNVPPRYQPPAPSLARTETLPSSFGMDRLTAPVAASETAKPPV